MQPVVLFITIQFYVKIFEVFPFLCSLALSWISLRNLEYFYQEIPFWDYYDIWNCIFHHLPIVNQGILNLTKCTSGRFIDLVLMESDSVTDQATAGTQVSKRSSWYSGYVHHMTSSTGQTRRLSGVHDFWEGGK